MTDEPQDIAETARRWIVRMASGAMTAEELSAFREWRAASPEHNAVFERERALWRALHLTPEQDRITRSTWKRLGRRGHVSRGLFLGSAAMVASMLVLYAPVASLWFRADHWSGITVQTLALTDGSRAILDSDTAIAIRYTATDRTITLLKGNALFEVKHDPHRPFRVLARDGVTEDVGTVFEVRQEETSVRVAVARGVVDVHAPLGAPTAVRLGTGDRTSYTDAMVARVEHGITPEEIAAWAHGDLILDDAPIHEAIAAIARYRRGGVYVLGSDTETPRISGAFRIDQADAAITTIAATAGMTVTHLPAGILLLRRRPG
ncbi:FecR family protein [Brytella acorum]|uniref:FecR domain-containing protein n=1 Tax=Brytella acorum TaxID=2959299 RepID=A0AA35XXJ6_9PROT|nr:FecR domain-containing protein [Brytella acorum]CAI9120368.1 FecR domain-containing protein [Brytella acorum]